MFTAIIGYKSTKKIIENIQLFIHFLIREIWNDGIVEYCFLYNESSLIYFIIFAFLKRKPIIFNLSEQQREEIVTMQRSLLIFVYFITLLLNLSAQQVVYDKHNVKSFLIENNRPDNKFSHSVTDNNNNNYSDLWDIFGPTGGRIVDITIKLVKIR